MKRAQKRRAPERSSSSNPKRKTRGRSELAQVVARLDAIADRLSEAVELLAQSALHASHTQPSPSANPTVEVSRPREDEHADDVEIPSAMREE
jgi:hypothetical protein